MSFYKLKISQAIEDRTKEKYSELYNFFNNFSENIINETKNILSLMNVIKNNFSFIKDNQHLVHMINSIFNEFVYSYDITTDELTTIYNLLKVLYDAQLYKTTLYGIAKNNNTSSNILTDIYKNSKEIEFSLALASNKNTPQEIINVLFNSDIQNVCRALAENENLSFEMVEKIINKNPDDKYLYTLLIDNDGLSNSSKQFVSKMFAIKFFINEKTKSNKLNFEKEILKRQELQYKYDKLKEYYGKKEIPEDSKLPIIRFELLQVNKKVIKHMYNIITGWVKYHSEEGYGKLEVQNEEIAKKLLESLNFDSVERQRIPIEMALNAIHYGGEMIEYFGLHDVLLHYFSNIDTTQWDRELEHMASNNIKIKLSHRE